MADDIKTILCGKCKVPLNGPSDGNDNNVFSCPKCGASDTRARVLEIVGQQAQEMAARHLQKSVTKAVRGSKIMKADLKLIPKRTYKFIIDGGLKF